MTIAHSPWVQRNLDKAQFAQPRGSNYGAQIHTRSTCSGYCGTSVMNFTHSPRCESTWAMFEDWNRFEEEIRDEGGNG
jgi:hypothetical protein